MTKPSKGARNATSQDFFGLPYPEWKQSVLNSATFKFQHRIEQKSVAVLGGLPTNKRFADRVKAFMTKLAEKENLILIQCPIEGKGSNRGCTFTLLNKSRKESA
jgi:hypothetical protein